MVIIKNKGAYVSIDLTAFKSLEKVKYTMSYLMKDQSWLVRVQKDGEWVEIHTPVETYQLDQFAKVGLPAKVGSSIPKNNFELALAIAELKNL